MRHRKRRRHYDADAMPAGNRALAVCAVLALIALGLAWELSIARTGRGTLALKVLPLVLTLPGLLRDRLSTYRVLALLVWLYVLEALVRASTERGAVPWLAATELLLALLLFGACVMRVRQARAGNLA
jgi:uncharacterized membrane protein